MPSPLYSLFLLYKGIAMYRASIVFQCRIPGRGVCLKEVYIILHSLFALKRGAFSGIRLKEASEGLTVHDNGNDFS